MVSARHSRLEIPPNPQVKAAPLCMQATTAAFREREVTETETVDVSNTVFSKKNVSRLTKKAVNGSDTDVLGSKLAPSGRDEIKSSVPMPKLEVPLVNVNMSLLEGRALVADLVISAQ
ncbi:hypothetical protein HYE67_007042 [Fusarium culmorum]|uniref:Uncharacterized protein n=1 Tax=Fusarium culmorum TaxID=5516 RepID=A0A7S8HX30_FUSCU|nr:hypothetical protein HYE67_007042 [Fusarium culmorum]